MTPPNPPAPQGRRWYEMQAGPDKRAPIDPPGNPGRARSLRTQQRAYEPAPAIRTPLHAHPGACSTGSPRRGPAELVSVPPSSTVTNTRGHPVMGDRHGPRTALDHSHAESGQCSLERR